MATFKNPIAPEHLENLYNENNNKRRFSSLSPFSKIVKDKIVVFEFKAADACIKIQTDGNCIVMGKNLKHIEKFKREEVEDLMALLTTCIIYREYHLIPLVLDVVYDVYPLEHLIRSNNYWEALSERTKALRKDSKTPSKSTSELIQMPLPKSKKAVPAKEKIQVKPTPCNDTVKEVKALHTRLNEDIRNIIEEINVSMIANGFAVYKGPMKEYIIRKVPGNEAAGIEDRIHFLIRGNATKVPDAEIYVNKDAIESVIDTLATYLLADFNTAVVSYLKDREFNNPVFKYMKENVPFVFEMPKR